MSPDRNERLAVDKGRAWCLDPCGASMMRDGHAFILTGGDAFDADRQSFLGDVSPHNDARHNYPFCQIEVVGARLIYIEDQVSHLVCADNFCSVAIGRRYCQYLDERRRDALHIHVSPPQLRLSVAGGELGRVFDQRQSTDRRIVRDLYALERAACSSSLTNRLDAGEYNDLSRCEVIG